MKKRLETSNDIMAGNGRKGFKIIILFIGNQCSFFQTFYLITRFKRFYNILVENCAVRAVTALSPQCGDM